jgi:hypothetical protein
MKVNERTERSALHFSAARGRRDFCARHEMWVGTSSARTSDEISSQGCPGRGERHLGSSPAGPGDSTRPRATMSGALPIAYDYRDFSLRPEVPAPDSLRGRESLSTSQGKAGIPLAESLPLFEGSVAWPWPRWEFVARARAREPKSRLRVFCRWSMGERILDGFDYRGGRLIGPRTGSVMPNSNRSTGERPS